MSTSTTENDKSNDETFNRDYYKLIKDMTIDILNTFPELKDNLHSDLYFMLTNEYDKTKDMTSYENIKEYCKSIYPERFFDILYENEEIFKKENTVNTNFLPNIDFRILWNDNISDKTRETIWKYLQLVLFSTVSMVNDKTSFGDTEHLFQAINEEEFKTKLEDTMNKVQEMFETNNEGQDTATNFNMEDLPNAESIHEHVTNMMGGKLGSLAKEIAEETAQELNLNLGNATSIGDVFKKMFKNPTSIIDLVKNVGTKLDSKLKSGNIKESELLAEATDMVKKMKNMPGLGNIQDMLSKMGMGNLGNMAGFSGGIPKGGKLNMNALQSQLQRTMRMAQRQENFKQKIETRQQGIQEQEKQLTSEEIKQHEERAKKAMMELLSEEKSSETKSKKKDKKHKKDKKSKKEKKD